MTRRTMTLAAGVPGEPEGPEMAVKPAAATRAAVAERPEMRALPEALAIREPRVKVGVAALQAALSKVVEGTLVRQVKQLPEQPEEVVPKTVAPRIRRVQAGHQ